MPCGGCGDSEYISIRRIHFSKPSKVHVLVAALERVGVIKNNNFIGHDCKCTSTQCCQNCKCDSSCTCACKRQSPKETAQTGAKK